MPQSTVVILILLHGINDFNENTERVFIFTFVYDVKLYLKHFLEAEVVGQYP